MHPNSQPTYGFSDQKSMPVCAGGFSTERGVSETNRVPRSRVSRTGRSVGRTGGTSESSCSCRDRFAECEFALLPAVPPVRLTAASFTARPATLETHQAPGLSRDRRTAVRAGWWFGRWLGNGVGHLGLGRAGSGVPEYIPKLVCGKPPVA